VTARHIPRSGPGHQTTPRQVRDRHARTTLPGCLAAHDIPATDAHHPIDRPSLSITGCID